ncbi:MAG: DUF503 domain-containing protein [Gemmatimonadetes bacterium]|nr:DUF503 domain-containing protein [Gemmatimonadota bacterium]
MSSVVVLTWQLRIPGCRSLKEKRMTVRSLRDRLRHGFDVSVAETGFQDIHDRAELTVALVASDGRLAESLANEIDRFVVESGKALVTESRRDWV